MIDMNTQKEVPMFAFVVTEERGAMFLNLREVVMIRDVGQDHATFSLSNGDTVTLHGGDILASIFDAIADHTLTQLNEPLREALRTIGVEVATEAALETFKRLGEAHP
jgi:hypothetical protein